MYPCFRLTARFISERKLRDLTLLGTGEQMEQTNFDIATGLALALLASLFLALIINYIG
jgi:hypothetical protein